MQLSGLRAHISNVLSQILQRLYILVTMGLLLGYSANASAIELPHEGASEPAFPTLRAAILFFLVSRALRLVLYSLYAISLPTFRISQISAASGEFYIILEITWTTLILIFRCFRSHGCLFPSHLGP